jgi:hypothetical protein
VLLLVFARLGVLVAEDEVDLWGLEKFNINLARHVYLVGSTAFVGTEHDDVGRGVGELFCVKSLVVLEELHVGTTALKTV